jgi:hypothetical protein
MFEKIEHDFGRIGPGSKNLCQFEFKNIGDSLLQIKNVSKTCGCTPFTLAKKEYLPGETGVLKVSYNADQRPGPSTKKLFVYSNDKKKPKIAIRIKADIVPKVSSNPTIINLSLNQENAGCPEITLRSTDDKPFACDKKLPFHFQCNHCRDRPVQNSDGICSSAKSRYGKTSGFS